MGRELGQSVVGIVGFGQIGRLVARYFEVFGARVIITDIDLAAVADSPWPAVGLEELLRTSDVISLHCPLTPRTRHLIDRERLRLVKPDAIVVNTARGALVDEGALVDAVTAGRLAGAAVDVYDREPPDFASPVFACDDIVTTPHVAAMTIQAQTTMAVEAASEIRRVLVDGLPPMCRNDESRWNGCSCANGSTSFTPNATETLEALFAALEGTALAQALRVSRWGYAAVNAARTSSPSPC